MCSYCYLVKWTFFFLIKWSFSKQTIHTKFTETIWLWLNMQITIITISSLLCRVIWICADSVCMAQVLLYYYLNIRDLCPPMSVFYNNDPCLYFSLLKTLVLCPGTGRFSTSWPLPTPVGKQLYGTWGRMSPSSRSVTTATGLVAYIKVTACPKLPSTRSVQVCVSWINQ